MISKFSVFADESKHIHNNEALTMTSLRGSSIRVLARPTGGVKCGDAEIRRAFLVAHVATRASFKAAISSASPLDFALVSPKKSPRAP
jgi:hypothetical protein